MQAPALVEYQIADEISKMLQQRNYIFDKLQENKKKLDELLDSTYSTQMRQNFLLVLRRWNSFTPAMVIHDSFSKGGGYFLVWNGMGIVIDPGFNFIELFHKNGFRIKDIDSIIITHAHIDHCVELESLLTLIYEYNDKRKKEAKLKKNERRFSGEPENNDVHEIEFKKINLYMNISSFKKFGNWITSCHNGIINKINMLEPGIEKQLDIGKSNCINIKSTTAIHDEIWDDKYSVGLTFTLLSKDTNEQAITIGITSDTKWTEALLKEYQSCSLLILHLGGIKSKEKFFNLPIEKRLYENHLGVLGTTLMLHNLKKATNSELRLAVISEFGEELKGIHKGIVDLIRSTVKRYSPNIKFDCIIGDVGTKIILSAEGPKLICEQKGCLEKATLEDVELRGRVIAHFCPKHTPVSTEMELQKLLFPIENS